MTSNEKKIIRDMHDEFEFEENQIQKKINDNDARIDIIRDNIDELTQYDDDRQMFSPRHISGDNTEKIKELNNSKDSLAEENNYLRSRLNYYSEKKNVLETLLQESNMVSCEDEIKDSKANVMISKNKIKNIIYKLNLALKFIKTEPGKSSGEIDSVINLFKDFIA